MQVLNLKPSAGPETGRLALNAVLWAAGSMPLILNQTWTAPAAAAGGGPGGPGGPGGGEGGARSVVFSGSTGSGACTIIDGNIWCW